MRDIVTALIIVGCLAYFTESMSTTSCESIQCITPDCDDPDKRPFECCLVCPSVKKGSQCVGDYGRYKSGEYFLDGCNSCFCNDGTKQCTEYNCSVTCVVDGKTYYGGETIPEEDPCLLNCLCYEGTPLCASLACLAPSCTESLVYTPVGECCPKCRCVLGSQTFNDEDIMPDIETCTGCVCNNGAPDCAVMNCSPTECNASFVYTPDGKCCPKCGCVIGDEAYENDEIIPNNDPCLTCICDNGSPLCASLACAQPQCNNSYTPEGECCPKCGCVSGGQFYDEGEDIPDDDPCSTCTCYHGTPICAITDCAPAQCNASYSYVPAGECCPKCRCVAGNQTYDDGEDIPDDDPCSTCTCDHGTPICAVMACPALQCNVSDRYVPSNECCEKCRCVSGNQTYDDGETIPDGNPCSTCVCDNGTPLCAVIDCAPPMCNASFSYVPAGDCCPKCRCEWFGQVYDHGETIPDLCQDCTCDNGEGVCVPKTCEPPPCQGPPIPLGVCCRPQCL